MRNSARGMRLFVLLALFAAVPSGCTNGPITNPFMPPSAQAVRSPSSPGLAQQRDIQQRMAALDHDNQQLQALLAQQQQQNSQMQAALQQSERAQADVRNQSDGGGSVARRGVSARSASHGGALPVARIQGT